MAGKRRSGKTRESSKWLDFALEEAAMAAIRVKGNYPAAQHQRLKPRRAHKRALGAVKHTHPSAIWHMLSTGETHRDPGADHFTGRDPERQTRRLFKQLERLGHTVTLADRAAAARANFSCQAVPASSRPGPGRRGPPPFEFRAGSGCAALGR